MSHVLRNVCVAPVVPGVSARCIMVSPALAEELLTLNTHNRKASEAIIRKYCIEIESGAWRPSSAGIGIDINGVLIDGQHRLYAIIRSGQTVPLLIVWNLPPEAQRTVDRQNRRTLFDVFTLEGSQLSRTAVQTATSLAGREKGWIDNYPADNQVREACESHRDALEQVGSNKAFTAGMRAALVVAYEMNAEQTKRFIATVLNPVSRPADCPAYRFSRWNVARVGARLRGAGGQRQRDDYMAASFALAAWLENRPINAVRLVDGLSLMLQKPNAEASSAKAN